MLTTELLTLVVSHVEIVTLNVLELKGFSTQTHFGDCTPWTSAHSTHYTI